MLPEQRFGPQLGTSVLSGAAVKFALDQQLSDSEGEVGEQRVKIYSIHLYIFTSLQIAIKNAGNGVFKGSEFAKTVPQVKLLKQSLFVKLQKAEVSPVKG